MLSGFKCCVSAPPLGSQNTIKRVESEEKRLFSFLQTGVTGKVSKLEDAICCILRSPVAPAEKKAASLEQKLA